MTTCFVFTSKKLQRCNDVEQWYKKRMQKILKIVVFTTHVAQLEFVLDTNYLSEYVLLSHERKATLCHSRAVMVSLYKPSGTFSDLNEQEHNNNETNSTSNKHDWKI